ncbi:glutathione S-transferase A3-like [Dysidea avara]|uniref:glutathione S-transferase A3-like n=1 Tax=Dysidea avara TaxID=196820 RepID=UPI00332DE5C0
MSGAAVVLHYFQGKGLAQPIRLMLWEAGVQYEERFVDTKEKLEALRTNGDLVFQQLPLLEIDGLKLIQSSAIVRYLARKYSMYGKTSTDQVHCDMLAEGIKDMVSKIAGYLFQADKEAWKAEVSPLIPRYLNAFTSYLSQNNNKEMKGYLLGDTITFVDITLFDVLERLTEIFPGMLEEYPFIKSFHARMLSRENIKKYYTSGAVLLTGDDYVRQVRTVLNRK